MLLSTVGGLLAIGAALALGHPPVVVGCVAIGAIGLLLSGIGDSVTDTLHAFEHFTAYANVFMISGLTLTAASIAVCWLGGGPIALSLAYLTGPLINAVGMGAVIAKREFRFRPHWNFPRFVALFRESSLVAGNMCLSSVHERLEQLLMPKLLSAASFGYFAAGLMPTNRLNVIPSGITTIFYPRISRACKDGTGRAAQPIRGLFTAMWLISVPTTLGVVLFGPWIASILFKSDPALCARIISITMWSLPIVATNWALGSALQASGNHDASARAGIIGAIVGFALCIPLMLKFGLIGACISWVLKPLIAFPLFALPFRRVFPGVLKQLPFLRILLAAGAMQATILGGSRLLGGSVPALCAIGFVASVVFYACLVLLRVVSVATIKGLVSKQKEQPEPAPAAVAQG
jgi:O-antigen/teichoic acid export membrane protein